MKLISWNCRGLLGAPTVRSLLDIQRRNNPDAFFLSETHLYETKAEEIMRKLRMDHRIVVPCLDGRSGGLLLVWKKEVRIYSRTNMFNCIDVSVEEVDGRVWRLTGLYGEPSWDNKNKTYQLIRDLHAHSNLLWVVIGDFNEILLSSEKEGGAQRQQSRLKAFQDALADCSLEDIGYHGDKFTFFRGGLRERLDRAVSNPGWMEMHPLCGLVNLDMGKSDHRPICLDTEYLMGGTGPRRRSGRKFEARWLEEELVEEVVRTAWQKAVVRGLCPSASEKLAAVHKDLHQWDRKILKGPRARLKTARQELEAPMREPYDAEARVKQQDLTLKIENFLEQEEIYWAQQGYAKWLRRGDRNTKFFHQFASARRRRNLIKRLKDNNNAWVEGNEKLKPLIFD